MTDSHISSLPTHQGGSRFGSHFITGYWRCPRQWAYSTIAPHPQGGVGLEKNPEPDYRLIGLEVHTGLEAKYRGTDPLCLTAAKAKHVENLPRYDLEKADPAWQTVEFLLSNYNDFYYGEQLTIATDHNGTPMVEYEIEAPLGYHDYVYTARVDLVVESNLGPGIYELWDHKTTDVSKHVSLCLELDLSVQLTGYIWLFSQQFPEMAIDTAVGNLLLKRAKNVDPCKRHITTRDPEDLAQFRREIVSTLVDIDSSLDRFHSLCEAKMPPYDAIAQSFRKQPSQECAWCPFSMLCKDPLNASKYAGDLAPRSKPDES